jgi:hypothetical protein
MKNKSSAERLFLLCRSHRLWGFMNMKEASLMLTLRRFCFCLIPTLILAAAGCQGVMNSDISGGKIRADQYLGKEPPLTILLEEFHGPAAKAGADHMCAQLLTQGLSEAFVIADADEAYLCYGAYRDRLDKNYHEDKVKISRIRDTAGKMTFGPGLGVLLPEAAPRSPYDLARARGAYTVMVATFDLYGHKHAATDYAAQLRKEGWPAYVFQGDVMSHVTIGVFNNEIFAADERGMPLSPEDKAALAKLNVHQQAAREVFAEWKQFSSSTKVAAVIISPDVKRILATFPYLNWDGHIFTAAEAAKMQGTATTRIVGPQGTAATELKQKGSFAHLVKSALVLIPPPEHGPALGGPPPPTGAPSPTPAPRGPIPSTNR